MPPPDEQLDADIAALLHRGAPRPTLPDDVSARLLQRAAASTVMGAGLFASFGAAAKVGLATVAAVVVTAGGVWTATRASPPVPPVPSPSSSVSLSSSLPSTSPPPGVAAVPDAAAAVGTALSDEADVVLNIEAAEVDAAAPPSSARRVVVVDEVTLLEQARVAIGDGRFAVAEAALLQHRRQHPRGSLSEEREALMVVALARRGEHARARQVAAAFHRRFAHSPFAAVVDAAVQ